MKSKLIFSLLVIFCVSISSSYSQALRFNLVNSTGYDLYGVYVSAGEQEDWGEDVLPDDIFDNGTSLTIDIPAEYGQTCSFDIRITLDPDEEDAVTFSDLDLCKIISLTLNSDGTYDVVWDE